MKTELEDLLELLEKQEGAQSLLEFIHINRKNYEVPYHLLPIAQVFWRIFNGEELKVCVSVPPRFGKTESIDTLLAKYILMFPHKTVGYISYGASLAKKQSRTIRGLVKQFGVKLDKSARSLSEWRTTAGGGLVCCGIGGGITGLGIDLMVIDDAIKNREEAESVTIKDKLEAWFSSTAITRLEPGGSVIVNGTRWAKDDLIGRIIEKEEELAPGDRTWEIIRLPAIDNNGNSLWESRWPLKTLMAKKTVLGEYDFESLYQGLPIPKGSVQFKEPVYYDYADAIGARWIIGVDTAMTTTNYADNSVITVACAKGGGEEQVVDIIEQWAGKVEVPELVSQIKAIASNYKADVYIESNGAGKAVAQVLRKIAPTLDIYEKASCTDKFTRALPVIAAWNTGRIRLPKNDALWTKPLLKEASNFTAMGSGSCKDDRIDSMVITFLAINQTTPDKKSIHYKRIN